MVMCIKVISWGMQKAHIENTVMFSSDAFYSLDADTVIA